MQNSVNRVQQNAYQLQTYLLHYGVYNPQLQNYQNIPNLITSQLNLLTQQMTLLPSFQDNPNQFQYNGNICQLIANGVYNGVGTSFANRNNVPYCQALEGGVLTQGLGATLSQYIQTASQLYTNNSLSNNFNLTQREAYLNDPFFTQTVQLLDYVRLHFDWMLKNMKNTLD